jgi:uncharacterized membrane protein required for colicin V production
MISLVALFWLMLGFFAVIGALRGWSKEVIALAGLILALFTLNTFGWTIVRLITGVTSGNAQADLMADMSQQFYLLGGLLMVIAFFSYQSVVLVGARLSGRERVQERLLGFIFGAFNGYLILGTLWSLLEYQATSEGWIRLPPGIPYAFDPTIVRPVVDSTGLEFILTHLPLPFLAPWLPILVVLVFLFVIVAII